VWCGALIQPSLIYIVNHQDSGGGFVPNLILIVVYLFFLIPLWMAGLVSLFRNRGLRPIGIACLLPLVLFLFVGKSYYAVGTVPIALAQGLVAVGAIKRPRLRTGFEVAVVVACVLQLVTFAQLTLPITPPDRIHSLGLDSKNELFKDSVGWEDVAHQVESIYGNLPNSDRTGTIIISALYGGEANGKVDVYDANFNFVKSFTDSSLPAGFAPFGISDINGLLYVTFADVSGGSGGFVDQFTEDGMLVNGKSLIQGAPLNQPWGIAAAPTNFGPLSNTLLISNNTNSGTINAFNPTTGKFVGAVKDTSGKAIRIDQLWGIGFGDGAGKNGATNQLFFTAGPSNNLAGTFGKIVFIKD